MRADRFRSYAQLYEMKLLYLNEFVDGVLHDMVLLPEVTEDVLPDLKLLPCPVRLAFVREVLRLDDAGQGYWPVMVAWPPKTPEPERYKPQLAQLAAILRSPQGRAIYGAAKD